LCVSLSKLTHFYSMITSALICICHICVFHWMFAEIPCVYAMCLSGSFLLSSWFSYRIEYKLRELFIIALAFEQDQLSITKELTQLLPGFVIERMIGTQQNNKIVDRFNNATIFQSDLVGFTKFCSTKTPSEIVVFLNELYVQLDEMCVAFGLEKIDTIGDAYICISFTGSPDPILEFALKLVEEVFDESFPVGIRIGIAMGYAIGTVLGECTKRYAMFGDALNRAIALENKSGNKQILCCQNTHKRASKMFRFLPNDDNEADNSYWLTQQIQRMSLREH